MQAVWGPVELNPNVENNQYLGRDAQPRQIVIRVGLNPNYAIGQTVSSIRETLYGLLTPGASDLITVRMMNGPNVVVQAVGTVNKMEIVPFSKDPEVQITIDCLESYLSASTYVTKAGITDFDNTIDNIGSVTVGFFYEMIFTADRAGCTIFAGGPATLPQMHFDYPFLDGDVLQVNTQKGRRSIKVKRGSTTLNAIRALSVDSVWLMMHPGENTFWMSPAVNDWGNVIYTPKYWGI